MELDILRIVFFYNYEANDYLDQFRDLEFIFKEFVGEKIFNPFPSYPDMKNFTFFNSLT